MEATGAAGLGVRSRSPRGADLPRSPETRVGSQGLLKDDHLIPETAAQELGARRERPVASSLVESPRSRVAAGAAEPGTCMPALANLQLRRLEQLRAHAATLPFRRHPEAVHLVGRGLNDADHEVCHGRDGHVAPVSRIPGWLALVPAPVRA